MSTVIKAVYDNGGKTFDRYSIYTDQAERSRDGKRFYAVLGCSDNPTHPQGFSQWSSGMLGSHNGKKISFSDLPKNVQDHVRRRLGGIRRK
jgi:hypothetical protein